MESYVASLIMKEADEAEKKYNSTGISAYIRQDRIQRQLRPNKTFLAKVVQNTNFHNKSLLRQIEEDSMSRLAELDERQEFNRRDSSSIQKRKRLSHTLPEHDGSDFHSNNRYWHQTPSQSASPRSHHSPSDSSCSGYSPRRHASRSHSPEKKRRRSTSSDSTYGRATKSSADLSYTRGNSDAGTSSRAFKGRGKMGSSRLDEAFGGLLEQNGDGDESLMSKKQYGRTDEKKDEKKKKKRKRQERTEETGEKTSDGKVTKSAHPGERLLLCLLLGMPNVEEEECEGESDIPYLELDVERKLSRNCDGDPSFGGGNCDTLIRLRNFTAPDADVNAGEKVARRVGVDDFQLLRVIGRGAYGKVFLVRKKTTQKVYAMKVLRKASIVIHRKTTEHTRSERSILEQISHPFIVKLWYAFQTVEKLYLILEYAAGGELFMHLANETMISEEHAAFYVGELLLALEHLHSLSIIYRDLKPENVLLDASGHIVLTDFGLSKVALGTNTICGTIEFAAPEVLVAEQAYGCEVDFWSLGVMCYDMLTGSPPFTGNNRKKIMEAILKKKVVFPKYISSYGQDLINKLLKKNPVQRLGYGPNGSAVIRKHGFFRKINWEDLAAKRSAPPIIPSVTDDPEDTSNFDTDFTSMPLESPPDRELATNNLLPHSSGAVALRFRSSDTSMAAAGDDDSHQNHFVGFSFCADSL